MSPAPSLLSLGSRRRAAAPPRRRAATPTTHCQSQGATDEIGWPAVWLVNGHPRVLCVSYHTMHSWPVALVVKPAWCASPVLTSLPPYKDEGNTGSSSGGVRHFEPGSSLLHVSARLRRPE